MEESITIEDILRDYGSYYEQAGQNKNRIKAALMQPSVTLEKYASEIKTNDTIYRMANPLFKSLIQPFKRAFTPKGGVEFFPNEIRLRQIKIDLLLAPHEIEDSWFGFLAGDSSKNIQDWPIVKYMLEEYVANQVEEDKENFAVYKGVYNEDGTGPADCLDGIRVSLINGAAHQKYPINVIEGVGEFDKDSIFDQIEYYDEKISELYTGKPVIHFLSQNWLRQFKKSKRANGFYMIDSPNQIDANVDFTQHIVCGVPSMNGTNDIFSTLKPNLLHITKRKFSTANIDIQKQDRDVKLLADWWEGVGFGCNQMVWSTKETITPLPEGSGSASGSGIPPVDSGSAS